MKIVNGMLILLIACGGCSKSLKVTRLTAGQPRGVTYGLTKTLLKVTVPYTIITRTSVANGITTVADPEIQVRKPVKIEPVYVTDGDNIFVIEGSELSDSVWLDATTKLTVSPTLVLTGAEADVTDKGPEVVESLVSSAISILKLGVPAGQTTGEPIKSISARLAAINYEIKTQVERLSDPANRADAEAKIKSLLDERKGLIEIVKAFEDTFSTKEETSEVEYTVTVDPSDGNVFTEGVDPSYRTFTVAPPADVFGGLAVTPTNVFVNVFYPDWTTKPSASATASTGGATTSPIPKPAVLNSASGLIYRPPIPARVTVTIGTVNAVDGYIPMPQFAPMVVADVKYKPWAKMKTTAKLDPANGGLIEYGVESTSSAERAAKVIENSTAKSATALADVQKAQVAAATAAAGAPAAALEAKKKLLQAQFDLEKLQAEYEKWKTDSGIK